MLRRARVPLIAAAGALAVASFGSMAVAGGLIPGENGEITACYGPDGQLRVVASAAECRKSEQVLAWNQEGEKGEKGNEGTAGPAGPTGPAGPAGPQGPPGIAVSQVCADGEYVAGINADGTLVCRPLRDEPPEPARLMINEVDYDQPGTDSEEFVELLYLGGSPMTLDGTRLVLFNGATRAPYSVVPLSGELQGGQRLVLAASPSIVTPGFGARFMPLPSATDALQNGSPDGMALIAADGTLLDALSYEGPMSGVFEGQTYSLVDGGAPATVADDGGAAGRGMSRRPDGSDTDNAAADWTTAPITPGMPNA